MNSYWINLPAADIDKMIHFYEDLGMTNSVGGAARVAFK